MKKYISILLAFVLTFALGMTVYADEEIGEEWYEMQFEEDGLTLENITKPEDTVSPQSLYIMGAHTTIQYRGSGKVGILGNVYCSQTVQSITSIFYLQKLSGGSWKSVSSAATSASNANSLSKTATVSNLSSGTYRSKIVSKVSHNGHSETITVYSGSITF